MIHGEGKAFCWAGHKKTRDKRALYVPLLFLCRVQQNTVPSPWISYKKESINYGYIYVLELIRSQRFHAIVVSILTRWIKISSPAGCSNADVLEIHALLIGTFGHSSICNKKVQTLKHFLRNFFRGCFIFAHGHKRHGKKQ